MRLEDFKKRVVHLLASYSEADGESYDYYAQDFAAFVRSDPPTAEKEQQP